MDKPTKPTDLVPRSFGGVKNNFSTSLQSSGYEDGVPAIYGGDNLNYQLDATGKELDYCEKICDYINAIPINKTPIVDANNKLVYTQYDIKVYNATDTYGENELVTGIVDGVKHIYRSKQNNNIGQALTNDVYWERTDILGGVKTIGRNVGEIVTSAIPLEDAGLHLLDGTILSGDGIYGEFIQYIADLYVENPNANYFCTESDWQSSVSTYGVCGKFVYDSTNNTVRLPNITGFTESTIDPTSLGDLVEAGLPNITGSLLSSGGQSFHWGGYIISSGAFYNGSDYGRHADTNTKASSPASVYFDASHSNSIYGNSNTVQPQSIKVLYYIVIATSTKTDIEVDIDEIATDLNGKADVDLTNINDTGKIAIAHNAMPSNTYEDLTLGANGATYTAPADGWFYLAKTAGFDFAYTNIILMRNSTDGVIGDFANAYRTSICTSRVEVKKGDVVRIDYNATGETIDFRFIYAQGSESEAQ